MQLRGTERSGREAERGREGEWWQLERKNIKIIGSAGKVWEGGINEDVSETKASTTWGWGWGVEDGEENIKAREIGVWRGRKAAEWVCEIKSGLMKGRVRLSELAGRREVRKWQSGGEVCVGKECWVGKEGRHVGLCVNRNVWQIERLRGKNRKLCLGCMRAGEDLANEPNSAVQPGPGSTWGWVSRGGGWG